MILLQPTAQAVALRCQATHSLQPPPPSRLKPPTSRDSSNGLMLVHGLMRLKHTHSTVAPARRGRARN